MLLSTFNKVNCSSRTKYIVHKDGVDGWFDDFIVDYCIYGPVSYSKVKRLEAQKATVRHVDLWLNEMLCVDVDIR